MLGLNARRARLTWIAALIHRVSGLALAAFLPVHFLVLGLAIDREATLDSFLRWTDSPPVKLTEGGLVFLMVVHMLGGLRLLLLENFGWRSGQARLTASAWGVSIILAIVFLAGVL